MIEIKLDSEGKMTTGTFRVQGDYKPLTEEICAILRILAKECPGPFEDAVEKHSLELMEELEDE
jgi:hypothetical protein